MKRDNQWGARTARWAGMVVATALAACAPTATPDGSVGDAGPRADVINERPMCSIGTNFTFAPGEFFFDGCNTCFCYDGNIACLSRACIDASPPPPFTPSSAAMCAAETRQLQVIEYEVRYPCGIPGGPVGVVDPRCQSLCEPITGSPTTSSFKCSRTNDANTILCLRDYSGTGA